MIIVCVRKTQRVNPKDNNNKVYYSCVSVKFQGSSFLFFLFLFFKWFPHRFQKPWQQFLRRNNDPSLVIKILPFRKVQWIPRCISHFPSRFCKINNLHTAFWDHSWTLESKSYLDKWFKEWLPDTRIDPAAWFHIDSGFGLRENLKYILLCFEETK